MDRLMEEIERLIAEVEKLRESQNLVLKTCDETFAAMSKKIYELEKDLKEFQKNFGG